MTFNIENFDCGSASLLLTLSGAAIEVDNYLVSNRRDFEHTYKMREIFKNSLEKNPPLDEMVLVLAKAIESYYKKEPAKIDEVYGGLEGVINDISNIELLDRSKIENLRDFFLNLSDGVRRYQITSYTSRRYLVGVD